MTDTKEAGESQTTILCKSCGLCCNGHLFAWVRLNANELNPAEMLGLNVIRSDPRQRGFTQPCPLWHGQCSVYTSPNYPRVCGTYKCKLLMELLDERTSLSDALTIVQDAIDVIRELEPLLPASPNLSFRERLVSRMEYLQESEERKQGIIEQDFRFKAEKLLTAYERDFGVNDLFDKPEEG
jgi:uncharacterized protein